MRPREIPEILVASLAKTVNDILVPFASFKSYLTDELQAAACTIIAICSVLVGTLMQ